MDPSANRVLRIAVPVPLLRRMDAVILSGAGGYTTRAEFILDAIEERITEVTVPEEEDAALPLAAGSAELLAPATALPSIPRAESGPVNLNVTAIPHPAAVAPITHSVEVQVPSADVLFGLHNRDYPSFWALAHLATATLSGSIEFDKFYSDLIKKAWEFGDLLGQVERITNQKHSSLFPTNRAKSKAAEGRFWNFAVGDVRQDKAGKWIASGPLFQWGAAGVVVHDGTPIRIGVTEAGSSLLEIVAGMTVSEPHPSDIARKFFEHLSAHAAGDCSGFLAVLAAIGTYGSNRQNVLKHFDHAWPAWSENEVATNAMGYIARAREWGLVEPKQIKQKYFLTQLGKEISGGMQ
jgi:hypothetical protein